MDFISDGWREEIEDAIKNNKQGAFTFTRLSDEQYKEVLRRFNAIKEEEI